MSDTSGFIVQCLRLKISGSAGLHGQSPYMVGAHTPVRIDTDTPAVWYVDSANDEPSVFPTEKEARDTIEDVLARVRAIVRIGERTGKWKPIGCATSMIPRDFGSGEIGGWEVVPYVGWVAEREEEQRFHDAEAREQLAHADSAAQAAQERADALRGEIKPEKPRRVAGASQWLATDTPKVQRYVRQDGSEAFRGRSDGKVSPSFPTIEQAVAWVEGDRGDNPVIPPERVAAMEALREVVQR